MANNSMKRALTEILALVIYVVFVIGILSLSFGFGAGGFDRSEILAKNNFYIPYGIIFLLGIVAVKLISVFYFKGSNEDNEGSIIHDPEQTPLKDVKVFQNPFLLGYLSIIVFSLFGWWFSTTQTFFADVPVYEQQFTKGADIFFSMYPASPSETLGAIFLISLVGFAISILVKKKKITPLTSYFLFIIGGTFVSFLYGIINHLARYGSSAIALKNVAVFWTIGGLLTTVTGSAIPFLIMHDINNFFVRFSKLFSSDIVTITTFMIIGILVIAFVLLLIRKGKKKVK
jgi:hypothetical protein